MATTELNSRIVLCNKTAEEWKTDTTVLLKGEFGIEIDTRKMKVGTGTNVFKDLPYANITPEEVQDLISASSHSHSNKSILDLITSAFTTELKAKLDGIAEEANKTVVDSSLSSSSTNPVQNKIIKQELDKKVSNTRTVNGHALSANVTLDADDVGAIPASQKGAASGVAQLDASGKVPTAQLPSFVDDVVEGYASGGKFYKDSAHASEITCVADKIYVDLSTNKTYRWSGTTLVEISQSLALGETSSTAFAGDKGKVAYDHSKAAHAPSNAERNIIVGIQKNGTDVSVDPTSRKVNITVPTKVSELTNDSGYLKSNGVIDKAKQLNTARAIDGVNFNGTAAIDHYGECSTAAGTASKVVDKPGFVLAKGARITVKFTVTNTTDNPTLNVGGTGAKAIIYRGAAINKGYLAENRVYEFIYDGTDWEIIGDFNTDTRYSAGAGLTLSGTQFKHSNSVTAGTAKGDDSKTLTFGGTFKVPTVTYDSTGHITGSGTTTMTMPATPTTITGNAGSATQLKNARNFSITGKATAAAVSFNGTKDVALNVTKLNANGLYQDVGDVLVLNGCF